MREIQAELGKTDEEMDEDLELSPLNLMRFEPQAEEGAFDLVMQVNRYLMHVPCSNIIRRLLLYFAAVPHSLSRHHFRPVVHLMYCA